MWQVLSVIFSYAAFTCDIILNTCGSNIQCVKYPEFKFSIPINVSSSTDSYLIYCRCILCKLPTCIVK